MIGKFVVLAAVCVSLAQVRCDEPLENAIKKGLARAESINRNGERRIEAAIREVSLKKKLIEAKSAQFVQKAEQVQTGVEQALHNVAENVRQKARETNRPESVFKCIDQVEENANNQIEGLTRKFAEDIARLERVKLENIDTYSKPLETMGDALKERYERTVAIINDSKIPRSVEIAVSSFAKWLDLLFSEISRILSQVNTAMTNYQRDANNYFTNSNRQITRIKSSSLRNIRQCLYRRDAIFGEY